MHSVAARPVLPPSGYVGTVSRSRPRHSFHCNAYPSTGGYPGAAPSPNNSSGGPSTANRWSRSPASIALEWVSTIDHTLEKDYIARREPRIDHVARCAHVHIRSEWIWDRGYCGYSVETRAFSLRRSPAPPTVRGTRGSASTWWVGCVLPRSRSAVRGWSTASPESDSLYSSRYVPASRCHHW